MSVLTFVQDLASALRSEGFNVSLIPESDVPLRIRRPSAGVMVGWPGLEYEAPYFFSDSGITGLDPRRVVSGIREQFNIWRNANMVSPVGAIVGGAYEKLSPLASMSSVGATVPAPVIQTSFLARPSLSVMAQPVQAMNSFSASVQQENVQMPVYRTLISPAPGGNGGGGLISDIGGLISGVSELLPKLPIPLPGSSSAGQIGAAAGQVATRSAGAVLSAASRLKGPAKIFATLTAAGLTADQISRLISSGAVSLKTHRRRGISPTELRGFRKVNNLLCSVGMRPARPRRSKCKK